MNWTISLRGSKAEGQALGKNKKDVRVESLRQTGRLKEIRQGLMERRWGILVSHRGGLQGEKNDFIFCQLTQTIVTAKL